jgi:hypothetical protein
MGVAEKPEFAWNSARRQGEMSEKPKELSIFGRQSKRELRRRPLSRLEGFRRLRPNLP